jgi:uncharacterized protein YutE (UPF0331/DUF86 family)
VVDEERVTRLLARARADVAVLRELAVELGDGPAGPASLDAVKYRFITAIEGCARTAHHVVAAEGWAAPESNADALRELGAHGVLDEATTEAMVRAAGFRNVLVHQYAEVDDTAVVANLERLDDIDAFARQVIRWLDGPVNPS